MKTITKIRKSFQVSKLLIHHVNCYEATLDVNSKTIYMQVDAVHVAIMISLSENAL